MLVGAFYFCCLFNCCTEQAPVPVKCLAGACLPYCKLELNLASAEQGLHRAKGFSASHPTPLLRTQHGDKKMWGDSQDSWPQLAQGTSHTLRHQYIKLGNQAEGDIQGDGICHPRPPVGVRGPCCPGDSWARSCPWEEVNEFLGLFYLCAQLLLDLLKCIYINSQAFLFLLLWLSPPSHHGGSE